MSAILQHPAPAARAAAQAVPDRTAAVPFHHVPTDDACLLQVVAGLDSNNALAQADIFTDFVTRQLEAALADQHDQPHVQFHCDDVYTLVAMLEMAKALRTAAGAVA